MSPTSLEQPVHDMHQSNDYSPLVEPIPYAKLLSIEYPRLDDDVVLRLSADKDNIGNPTLPAIHGGMITGFMEHVMMLHLLAFMSIPHPSKIIDFFIDYLCVGHPRDIYVQYQVWYQGRRVANVAISAWQTIRGEPIATARIHFKVDEP